VIPAMPIADSGDVDQEMLKKWGSRLDKLKKIDDPLRKRKRGGCDATSEFVHEENRRNPETEI
jgi:hypothetical protein